MYVAVLEGSNNYAMHANSQNSEIAQAVVDVCPRPSTLPRRP